MAATGVVSDVREAVNLSNKILHADRPRFLMERGLLLSESLVRTGRSLRVMNVASLSVRIDRTNPDHHLWNNNGTWFVHYTVHPDTQTKLRVRHSLGTKSRFEARRKRDNLFRGLDEGLWPMPAYCPGAELSKRTIAMPIPWLGVV